MEVETVFEITCQLAKAMEHLYQKSIIHRDIKPANIILHRSPSSTGSGNPSLSQKDIQSKAVILKLGDFGLSRIGTSTCATMSACGTGIYMAPEVFRQSLYGPPRYNNNADLWSIGVLLYKALYDEYPCEKYGSYFDMMKIGIPYHANNKILSPSLISLLSGLLEKDPNKRLSMTEFFQHNFIITCQLSRNPTRPLPHAPTHQEPFPWRQVKLQLQFCLIVFILVEVAFRLGLYDPSKLDQLLEHMHEENLKSFGYR